VEVLRLESVRVALVPRQEQCGRVLRWPCNVPDFTACGCAPGECPFLPAVLAFQRVMPGLQPRRQAVAVRTTRCAMVSCRVAIVGILACACLSLACGDSRSSLTPTSPTPAPTSPTLPQTFLTITFVSPSSGPTSGGDVIRISGTGFQPATTVIVDGIDAEVRSVSGASAIVARTPAHATRPRIVRRYFQGGTGCDTGFWRCFFLLLPACSAA
jgi:hypothetical protein